MRDAAANAAAARATSDAANSRAEAADSRADELKSAFNTLQQKYNHAEPAVVAAKTNTEAAEKAKSELMQRLTDTTTQLRALQTKHDLALERATKSETEADHLRTQIDGLSHTVETLEINLTAEKASLERALAKQQTEEASAHQFEIITQQILKKTLEEAKQGIGQLAETFQKSSDTELQRHAETVARTLEPLQDKLQSYNEAIESMKKGSQEAYGGLKQQIAQLQDAERSLHDQAKALTNALSASPKVKGNYGELILRQLVEFVGMLDKCHFETQASRETEEGRKIPDLVVSLPGGQKVLVDAKAVMDACVQAQMAQDDAQRSLLLKKHCDNVKSRVSDLASKNYFVDHQDSVEAVVLFLPAENLYATAMENDPGLTEFAMSRNVIVCGPNSLMLLLKVSNQLWRRAAIEKEATDIKDCGEKIYNAACLFIERYAKLGARIQQLGNDYNEAAGTLNGNLIPKGRSMGRFAAVASGKGIEDLPHIKEDIHPFSSPEAKKILHATTEKLPGLVVGDETAEFAFSAGDNQ